jgi:type IV secretory pathway VirB3-like protein
MIIETDAHRNEQIIIKYRKRAMFIGVILWIAIISSSIVGTVFINWTMIPISIFVGLLLGLYIGHHTNQKIIKETGLDLETQQAIWKDKFYGK